MHVNVLLEYIQTTMHITMNVLLEYILTSNLTISKPYVDECMHAWNYILVTEYAIYLWE